MGDNFAVLREPIRFLRQPGLRLVAIVLSLCIFPWEPAAALGLQDERTWSRVDGFKFKGEFVTIDQKSGNFVFRNSFGKYVEIAPDDLSRDDHLWIEATRKHHEELRERSKNPPIAITGPLDFTKEASIRRAWTNSDGKVVTQPIADADRDTLKLSINGRGVTVPLHSLREEDRAAALLWTGATNRPLSFPEGTFVYRITKDGAPLAKFSIVLSGKLSRITTEHTETAIQALPGGQRKKLPFTQRIRVTTDHLTGAFQRDGWTMNGDKAIPTHIGKWKSADFREPPETRDFLEEVLMALPDSEMTAAGPWLGRKVMLGKIFNQGVGPTPLVFLRFPDSNLPAALRIALGNFAVMDTAPPDPALRAPKPRNFYPLGPSHKVFFPYGKELLGTLQLHGIAPIAMSFKFPSRDRAKGNKLETYVITLEKADFTPPPPGSLQVPPEAQAMEKGTGKKIPE